MVFEDAVGFLVARSREASSQAGLALVLTGLGTLVGGQWALGAGQVLLGLGSILVREKGSPA